MVDDQQYMYRSAFTHLLTKMKVLVGFFFHLITAVARGVEPFSSSGDSSAGFLFSGGSSLRSIGDSSASSASGDLHPEVVPADQGSGNYSGGNDIVQPTDIVYTTSEPTAAPTSKFKSSLCTSG